jgi:signal transduction histidine kinase
MQPSDRAKLVLKLAVVGLAFFATARVGLELEAPSTLVWAPAGIALAAMLRWGPVVLLATIPAHLAANLANGLPLAFAATAALTGAAEAVSAAWLLGRLRFDHGFGSIRDVFAFAAVAAVASPCLAALIGTAGIMATGQFGSDEWIASFARWWVGDGVGALVVTPLLLLSDRFPRVIEERASAAEATLLISVLLLVAFVAFAPWLPLSAARYPISFVVLPGVAWVAYRLGPAGAAGANIVVAVIALRGTLDGAGSFARETMSESLFLLWSFLSITSLTSLVLGALVATRERTERALREAYDALQAIEAATQAGSWIWRPDLSLHLGSTRQRELHGVDEHANPIPQDALQESIHPDDRGHVLKEFGAAWRNQGRIQTEYRVVLADGSVRWLAASGACVPIDPTRPTGTLQMVGVHVDITERKQMEAAVRRGERLVSIGTFAAGVAHELNNPLGTILLAAESARPSASERGVVANALDDIIDDARRAGSIVRSVLRFAKEEAAERTRLELRSCLSHAIDLTRSYCFEKGVALELRSPSDTLEILANATEIEQLVQNLVRNAAEACNPRGRIRVEAQRSGDEILVIVSDDGRGMTAEEVERAFDPFYTTRTREGGSGLGLSICHGIARGHDGSIEIESSPGHGTRVRIRLPSADRNPLWRTRADDGATPAG